MMSMKIDGACHCGSISFEAEIDPGRVEICHCTDCQSLSGSAYRTTVPVAAGQFTMRGTPTLYTKTAENGKKRFQAFCPKCGSPIFSSDAEAKPAVYHIRIGTVHQRNELVPSLQIWCRSAQPWVNDLSQIARVEKDVDD
jgi:hypothetical protein